MNDYEENNFPLNDLNLKVIICKDSILKKILIYVNTIFVLHKSDIGCFLILLRKLNTDHGLANGRRFKLTAISNHVLTGIIVSTNNDFHGKIIQIPKIGLYTSELPYKFKRIQFPVRLSFALSIHISQGQFLNDVGVYLEKDVFSHGMVYVMMLSRTTNSNM